MLLYPALLSLGAGVAVSCAPGPVALLPQASSVRPLAPAPEMEARPRAAPRPARKPTPPGTTEGRAPTAQDPIALATPTPPETEPATETASTAPPAASPGTPPPETSELIGLDQPAAARLFGQAAERSEEPPATVWRYKNGTCELDLFFYLDLRSGRMRTLHYALRGDGGGDTARRQDCLRSLAASRRG